MLSNSQQKHIRKLHQKKYRQKYNEFLVEGKKGVKEAIISDREVISVIFSKNNDKNVNSLLNLAKKQGINTLECDQTQVDQIKTTQTFPGIMAIVKAEKWSLKDFKTDEPVICFDQISDPGNLGTIIRSSDWFGYNNILLSENSVEAHNEKVVRSSMGSFFRSKIIESRNLLSDLKWLKEEGYSIYGLDTEGESLKESDISNQDSVFVFGNESHGISDGVAKLLDNTYTIEGEGGAESLNVGVSAAIVLFEIS
ncbi:MAG: TrmH family RNA methyltransferase [Candidatus Magasanikbacteria bacterium]